MDYENIARCLSKYTNYGIFYKKRKMYVPKNTRIVKYTLYIKYPTIKTSTIDKPFMDIYNCGSYELTPYIEKKYKNSNLRIGNIYVQLYYSMVDMWLLKLLTQLRGITNEYFLENYNYYITTIKQLKKNVQVKYNNNYMGINYDLKIEQKIILTENQIKKTSYYPELNMKTSKKYLLVATSSS